MSKSYGVSVKSKYYSPRPSFRGTRRQAEALKRAIPTAPIAKRLKGQLETRLIT